MLSRIMVLTQRKRLLYVSAGDLRLGRAFTEDSYFGHSHRYGLGAMEQLFIAMEQLFIVTGLLTELLLALLI